MLCENCNTEHPEDQVANPHYCIARMQERIEALEAAAKERNDYLDKISMEYRDNTLKFDKQIAALIAESGQVVRIYESKLDCEMDERIRLQDQIAAIKKSRDEWKHEYYLMEAAEKKAEEQCELYLRTNKNHLKTIQSQSEQFAALTAENKQLNDLFTDLDNPDNAHVLWKGKYLIQRVEDHDAELKRFYDLRAENEKLKEVLATRTIVR